MIDPLPESKQPKTAGCLACPQVVRAHREALEQVIRLAGVEEYAGHTQDFGVVYVGGGRYWPGVVVGCRMLRRLGYEGPIQVWHGHRGDPEPVELDDVRGLDVTIVSALDRAEQTRPRILHGWEAKLHAIRHCNFRRLLYLDADAYCVSDPTRHAAILDRVPFAFWRDLPSCAGNVKWPMVWPSGDAGVPQVQGGQLWIDREKAWPLVMTTDWLCQHSDYYFRHGFGDQDMWRIALAAGGWPWHEIGLADWRHPAFICRQDGADLIVHRCRGKLWRMMDIPEGRRGYSGPTYHLPREVEVWDILADVLQRDNNPAKVFDHIYRCGLWGQGSGAGSDPGGEAAEYIRIITAMAVVGGWQTAVDAGCGDGRVARAIVEASGIRIIGIDCVGRILPPSDDRIEYRTGDITKVNELPTADVLMIKDVLHHWPNDLVRRWLGEVIRAGRWRWLIATQDRYQRDHDTHLGGYRALDSTRQPLNEFGPWRDFTYSHKSIAIKELRKKL
jgi:hypothetical protein